MRVISGKGQEFGQVPNLGTLVKQTYIMLLFCGVYLEYVTEGYLSLSIFGYFFFSRWVSYKMNFVS